jgi:hypothetical protein
MTAHEVYITLFWFVTFGYIAYLGWSVYRIVAERSARARHPSFPSREAGEMSRDETEGALAGPRSLVEFLFD